MNCLDTYKKPPFCDFAGYNASWFVICVMDSGMFSVFHGEFSYLASVHSVSDISDIPLEDMIVSFSKYLES